MAGKSTSSDGKSVTKTEYVTQQLRQDILCGMLEPGQKLVLKDVAERYMVSEQPVREAFKILQSEGLVVNTPHSGTKVSQTDTSNIIKVYELDKLLEVYSVCEALPEMDDDLIRQLNEKLVLMKYYMETNEPINYSRINREFHQLLHSKSIPLLQNMIFSCNQATRSFFRLVPERPNSSYLEHKEIMDAIKNRDRDRLAQAMGKHMDQIILAAKKVAGDEASQ